MKTLLNYKLIAEHHNLSVTHLHNVLWLAMTGSLERHCSTDWMFRLFGMSEELMREWNRRIEEGIRAEQEQRKNDNVD